MFIKNIIDNMDLDLNYYVNNTMYFINGTNKACEDYYNLQQYNNLLYENNRITNIKLAKLNARIMYVMKDIKIDNKALNEYIYLNKNIKFLNTLKINQLKELNMISNVLNYIYNMIYNFSNYCNMLSHYIYIKNYDKNEYYTQIANEAFEIYIYCINFIL